VNEAEQALPGTFEAALLRAELLAAQDRLEAARRVLESARDHHPKAIELWAALAGLAERQGDPAQTLAVVEEAQRRLGDTVEVRLLRAQYWAQRGGAEARAGLATLLRGADRLTRPERLHLLDGMADAYYRAGDKQEAGRLWQQLAGERHDDLRVRRRLLDLALQEGEEAAVQRLLKEIREIEGEDGTLWRYGEAARLIRRAESGDRTNLEQARAWLSEVAARRPAWSVVPLLEAEIADLERNTDKAVAGYQRAFTLGERGLGLVERLATLLVQLGRYDEADEVLERRQEEGPLTGASGRLAAEVALHRQDRRRAVTLAQKAVAGSQDYRDYLWLGQLQAAAGQPAQAEESLNRALQLADGVPDTWVALVQFLVQADRKAEAEDKVRAARSKLPPAQAPLALGQCYEALGHQDQAEGQYRAALSAGPADVHALQGLAGFYLRSNQPQRAEPVLRQLLEPALRAPQVEAAWARRSLAVALAAGGDYPQLREALALLEQNRKAGGNTVEDQRVQAVVLRTHPGHRREALRLLLDLSRRRLTTPDEEVLLAQMQEADHDWSQARERLLRVLAAHGAKPAYLASLVRGLLRHSGAAEAQPWLAQLEKADPQGWPTQELKARLLQAQVKGTAAVALLREYAQGQDAQVGFAAALLEEFGHTGAAEELYRLFVTRSARPDAVLALANFLGRHQRTQEALDLCERAGPKLAPETVALAGVTVLYAAPAKSEDCRRVEQWLEAALRKNPNGIGLWLQLAALRNLQERYADAEALYRRVLDQEPRQALALYNLAWLLAVRGGSQAEALKLIQQALEVAGPLPDFLGTRAVIYLKMGQADQAIKDLEAALDVAPTALRYYYLALAQQTARNRSAALAAFRQAQAAGLKIHDLHPLERNSYRELLAALGQS
jgi:tetratricopeptide (TPR) repeat protein